MASDKALLRAISDDRALGSAMLFSHRHEYASPDFHVDILDLWRSADELVLIEAFREGAKTTLAEEFLCMEAAFGNFFYCIVFGETYAKACQKIEAIAHEALHNHKLAKLFGTKILKKKPIENKIVFASGAMIEGVGWEQEVTGFKYLDHRPDRAYLDDVENLERVRSPESVDASIDKLYREVMPAMDKKRRKIRITETPRASDCMVTRLRNNPDWLCRSFPICNGDIDDPKTVSAWPSRYPMDWIREERDRYARAGKLKAFHQEFMLSVDTTDTKPFTEAMIRGVDMAPAAWLPRYPIYDPSRTANLATSDRTGKVVVSRLGTKIIVHESGGYFWKPDELRADLFAAWQKHHAAEVGVEKNSLDLYLTQPIRAEAMRRGVSFPLRPLQAPQDKDKIAFIMGLHPYFVAGDIVLVGGRAAHPQLVAEILNFPGGRLDILNALAYSPRMFAGQPVYEDFGEANVAAAHAPSPGETLYAAWNASPSDVVCVAVLRQGRHLSVAADWAASGSIPDAVRSIGAELRASFPGVMIESYAPPELHDSAQRVALVPALRSERFHPLRGEMLSIARGGLADRIRTTIRDRRTLTVDARAARTTAALAGGYKYTVLANGRQHAEPEAGVSRLVAEAIESLAAALNRATNAENPVGAHFGTNAQGQKYITSLPARV